MFIWKYILSLFHKGRFRFQLFQQVRAQNAAVQRLEKGRKTAAQRLAMESVHSKKSKGIDGMVLAYEKPPEPLIPGSTLLIYQTLSKKPKYRLWTELTDQEISAIGFITIQWAHLEHMLLIRTKELADAASIALPEDAKKLSFKVRLHAWYVLIREKVTDPEEQKRLFKLHQRIASAEDKRHKVTHGLWDFGKGNPKILIASSFRVPFDFEQNFKAEELANFANTIAEINFDLHYPKGPRSLVESQSYMSRGFMMEIMKDDS